MKVWYTVWLLVIFNINCRRWGASRELCLGVLYTNLGHLPSTAICSSSSTREYFRLWASSSPSRQGRWRYLSSTTQSLLQHWSTSPVSSLWSSFLWHSCFETYIDISNGIFCAGIMFGPKVWFWHYVILAIVTMLVQSKCLANFSTFLIIS